MKINRRFIGRVSAACALAATAAAPSVAQASAPQTVRVHILKASHGHFLMDVKSRGGFPLPPSSGIGPLIDHGGNVQTHPVIHFDFWGVGTPADSEARMSAVSSITAMAGSSWANIVTQYGSDNTMTLGGVWTDPTPPPMGPSGGAGLIDQQAVDAEAMRAAKINGWQGPNSQIIVMTPTGASIQDEGFCAYHGFDPGTGQTFALLPSMADPYFNPNCDGPALGADGATQMVLGHEVQETITDPQLATYYTADGSEIGDLCAWTGISSINGTTQQPLWDNSVGNPFLGCTIGGPDGNRKHQTAVSLWHIRRGIPVGAAAGEVLVTREGAGPGERVRVSSNVLQLPAGSRYRVQTCATLLDPLRTSKACTTRTVNTVGTRGSTAVTAPQLTQTVWTGLSPTFDAVGTVSVKRDVRGQWRPFIRAQRRGATIALQ